MTTSVNMKQAVAGSTVHFRCGGSAVVTGIEQVIDRLSHMVQFDKSSQGVRYYDNGQYSPIDTPFDIISIDPPPFKLEDLRSGMAFNIVGCNGLRFYVGKSVMTEQRFFETSSGEVFGFLNSIETLTRAPEHDKVQP